ncbi:hypothetical protein AtDm6_3630 [Acetobacter tropicalis]|uniref:Uncharacterized protein n=1 Tax=Acetobacter tropicalis TaxID=104102 RepID=A0A095AV05_9PROT|nr:hypothetical protein AtDm6_3630 [Acetobacter tropicalis]
MLRRASPAGRQIRSGHQACSLKTVAGEAANMNRPCGRQG